MLSQNKRQAGRSQSDPMISNRDTIVISSLITMRSWEVLTKIIMEKPVFAKVSIPVYQRGKHFLRLPIHEVCSNKPPLSLMKKLVSAYPTSLIINDKNDGCLPIHYACRHAASVEVISYLMKQMPSSINFQDKYGCTPAVIAGRSSCKHRDQIVRLFQSAANAA